MAETNKSQMLSEAEIIEAINQDSLISVSLGAGQPQKNVKMSTLASVAAGLFPLGTLNMPQLVYGFKGDLNTLSNTGCYVIDSNYSGGLPSNRPSDCGVAQVIVFGNESFPCQLYLVSPDLSSEKFIRWSLGNKWTSWQKF